MSVFAATITNDRRVLVAWGGRTVATVAGERGKRLADGLDHAGSEAERQLLLARATGNFKRGDEQ